MSNEGIKITGKITIRDHETQRILYEKTNIITNNGLTLMADILGMGGPDLGWLAIGDDPTPVSATDTIMTNELFRAAFGTTTSVLNVYTATTTLTTVDAQFIWKEIGIFNQASGGTLFSHINVDYDHPSQAVNVDLQYSVTFTRT